MTIDELREKVGLIPQADLLALARDLWTEVLTGFAERFDRVEKVLLIQAELTRRAEDGQAY